MWVTVSDAGQVRRSFTAVRGHLIRDAEKFPKQWIGSPGGRERIDTYLHRGHGFWAALPTRRKDRGFFSCLIGSTDPKEHPGLDIDVEINIPAAGVNRRYGGAFLKDGQGRVYLAHSGKIGGGHEGVGKHSFRDFYRSGNWQRITWPDRKTSEMIVLAPVRHERLIPAIAHFAAEVARFKRGVRTEPESDFSVTGKMPAIDSQFANPTVHADPAGECWQAIVVAALADALRNRALDIRVEAHRNLVVAQSRAETLLLAVSGPDLAGAVGALVLTAANSAKYAPKKVLVVGDGAAPELRGAMQHLGIAVVRCRWENARPVFDGLGHAV